MSIILHYYVNNRLFLYILNMWIYVKHSRNVVDIVLYQVEYK